MEALKAKYCSACGYRLIDYKVFDHYDEDTGVAYYKVESVCPDWSWLLGKKHSKLLRGLHTVYGTDVHFFPEDEVKDIPER